MLARIVLLAAASMDIRRGLEVLRWEGAGRFLTRALWKTLRPVIRTERVQFFESDLSRPLPSIQTRATPTLRVGSRADLTTFADGFARLGVDLEDARERLDRGDVFFLAIARGELASLSWLSQNPTWVDEAAVWLQLGAGEASVYGGVTLPAWRGFGLAPALWRYVEQWAHEQGLVRLITWVRADNVQSVKTTLRLGRRLTRTVRKVWALGMARPRVLGVGDADVSPVLARTPPVGRHSDALAPDPSLPGRPTFRR